jgi:hypothetical protein
MKIRAVISSLALVSAMTLAGAASAQTMVGDMQIPADQMASFEEKCALIAADANKSLTEPADQSKDAEATGAVVANGTDDPNATTQTDSDKIEALLASMTPEQCKEAGLTK